MLAAERQGENITRRTGSNDLTRKGADMILVNRPEGEVTVTNRGES
jgi:hypothetical protein